MDLLEQEELVTFGSVKEGQATNEDWVDSIIRIFIGYHGNILSTSASGVVSELDVTDICGSVDGWVSGCLMECMLWSHCDGQDFLLIQGVDS